jgi:LAO/AO transport system kinase
LAKNRLSVSEYIQGVLQSDRVVLSRAITLVESALDSDQLIAEKVMEGILPYSGNSIRIGISGVPGVGKSTFIENFGKILVEKGHKVAVLAVDPSSQQSHGSILGDKTRMENLASDKRAYIRPSPAGSTLGGVSARTREGMLLCEAAGFDVILIETVGVGQSETVVKGMVDFFLLLMLAGAGDELQGIKKGIVEICDAMVINKADGSNQEAAKNARREYANALHLFPAKENGWIPPVKTCSSIYQTGLEEIWEMVVTYKEKMLANGYWEHNRSGQRINWLHENIRYLFEQRFFQNEKVKNRLDQILPEIQLGTLSVMAKAKELVDIFTGQIKDTK